MADWGTDLAEIANAIDRLPDAIRTIRAESADAGVRAARVAPLVGEIQIALVRGVSRLEVRSPEAAEMLKRRLMALNGDARLSAVAADNKRLAEFLVFCRLFAENLREIGQTVDSLQSGVTPEMVETLKNFQVDQALSAALKSGGLRLDEAVAKYGQAAVDRVQANGLAWLIGGLLTPMDRPPFTGESALLKMLKPPTPIGPAGPEPQSSAPAVDKQGAVRANISKLFPKGEPDDRNFVEFIQHLDAKRDGKRSDNDIAREFTGESLDDWPKAGSLLARYRVARNRGQVGI